MLLRLFLLSIALLLCHFKDTGSDSVAEVNIAPASVGAMDTIDNDGILSQPLIEDVDINVS
jgi:hypothetical protein